MATRANRAATAANKKGGRSRRRNQSVRLIDHRRSLEDEVNREAFEENRHESLARRRNVSMNSPTVAGEPGVIAGTDFTLRHLDRTDALEIPKSSHFRAWCHSFGRAGEIPKLHTADGEELSPPIQWNGASPSVQEYALICEDITVPEDLSPIVHWLIYRIPGNARQLPEGIAPGENVAKIIGALQGTNDLGRVGYNGPSPPFYDNWHHYRFRLFALDRNLNRLRPALTREELFARMRGHVLTETEFLGRYRRTRWTLRGI